ncbi:hypothetical protein Ahos_0423 [Acidianus hospitalis W1]|uniref:Uncharacterized protein n=1 Tax=Acidianus hospitalis (strain W1) TaxID=933801 RepID=F4B5U6_ACIHW|nr:hypothetical protein Ahos_0423 [Acidianus hospitalis W1]
MGVFPGIYLPLPFFAYYLSISLISYTLWGFYFYSSISIILSSQYKILSTRSSHNLLQIMYLSKDSITILILNFIIAFNNLQTYL